MATLKVIVGRILSPTRAIIDFYLKYWNGGEGHAILAPPQWLMPFLPNQLFVSPGEKADVFEKWNTGFLWASLFLCLLLSVFTSIVDIIPRALVYFISFVAFSRCNEIVYAFYSDALNKLENAPSSSTLKPIQRIRFAIRSYAELLLNFALIYFFLPSPVFDEMHSFDPSFHNFIEALYFSGVTITTLGYGDIKPTYNVSQLLCVYEAISGLLLVVLALATYIGMKDKNTDAPPS